MFQHGKTIANSYHNQQILHTLTRSPFHRPIVDIGIHRDHLLRDVLSILTMPVGHWTMKLALVEESLLSILAIWEYFIRRRLLDQAS
jgi:hypothetical protein